jgi:hypothetical protein
MLYKFLLKFTSLKFLLYLVSEEQCLNQIFLDEQFGAMDNPVAKKAEEDKKRLLPTSFFASRISCRWS